MGRIAILAAILLGWAGPVLAQTAPAPQTSEGHPTKWQAVEKSMVDFLNEGFELKTVVYDTNDNASKTEPDVHYFLQKKAQLVRCDFRKRDTVSIYYCYLLVKPK